MSNGSPEQSPPQLRSRSTHHRFVTPHYLASRIANSAEHNLVVPAASLKHPVMSGDTCWIGEPCVVKTSPGNTRGTYDSTVYYCDCQSRVAAGLSFDDVRHLPLGCAYTVTPVRMREWMSRASIVVLTMDRYRLHSVPDTHPSVIALIPHIPDAMNIGIMDGTTGGRTIVQAKATSLRQWMLRVFWDQAYGGQSSLRWAANPDVLTIKAQTTMNRCVPGHRFQTGFQR